MHTEQQMRTAEELRHVVREYDDREWYAGYNAGRLPRETGGAQRLKQIEALYGASLLATTGAEENTKEDAYTRGLEDGRNEESERYRRWGRHEALKWVLGEEWPDT